MRNANITKNFINLDEIIMHKELQAYYQPMYDMGSKKIVACEALARIVKENGEIVPPGKFIPFLDESKDALKLDWYILEEVCAVLKELKESGAQVVPMSINFSKMHALESNFIEKMTGIVDKYGVAHDLIHLEVTEENLLYYEDDANYLINELRKQGFKLAVDNFGTGVSSLNFIRGIDFDILKVDRSMISSPVLTKKDYVIVKAMIELGHDLGLEVVAEGVETKEQVDMLSEIGCTTAQGFFYSKPINVKLLYKQLG